MLKIRYIKNPRHKCAEEERIIIVSFCGRKPPEEPYSPPEVVPGDINSYIKNRLDDQITWYDKKAQQAQRTYKRMQFNVLRLAWAKMHKK